MPYYELLCVASGKLGRTELGDLLRKTCRAFMDNGGTVTRISPLGANGHGPRDLAYRIRINQVSYNTGFFVNVCAFASPTALAEVDRQLKIDERMLRHLALKRPIRTAVEPLPLIDELPPGGTTADPNDPNFALQKFLEDYEREFPDGTTYSARDAKDSQVADKVRSMNSDKAVKDVVASLKASSKAVGGNQDPGLSWLSDLKKDPSEGA